jgi:hypothetical protein
MNKIDNGFPDPPQTKELNGELLYYNTQVKEWFTMDQALRWLINKANKHEK